MAYKILILFMGIIGIIFLFVFITDVIEKIMNMIKK